MQVLSDITKWEYILDEDGKMIGALYDGGHERDFINYNYPELHVYIKKNEDIVDLSSANLKLNMYTYDIQTNTIGSLEQDISKEENENFFKITYENLSIPYARYYRLSEYDKETNNFTEYEFDMSVVGYKNAGTEKSVDIYLNITTEDEENKSTIEKIIDSIIEPIMFIADFFINFSKYLLENLKNAMEFIFIPDSDFLEEWANNMKIKIDEKVPILSLPFQILQMMLGRIEFVGGTLEEFSWGELQFIGKTIIPAGNFSFYNLVESNEAIKNLREYGLLFTDFILCMMFVKYIRKKLKIVFGQD